MSATRLHILTTAKIYQLNTYNKVNLACLITSVVLFRRFGRYTCFGRFDSFRWFRFVVGYGF